jgi:hypothetical protein
MWRPVHRLATAWKMKGKGAGTITIASSPNSRDWNLLWEVTLWDIETEKFIAK